MNDDNGAVRPACALRRGLTSIVTILVVGLLVRVLWWAYAAPTPVADFESYRNLAEGLLESGRFGTPNPSAFRLPGYPALLAALSLVRDSVAWLSFVNVILSTALIYVVYELTRRLTSARVPSLIAAWLCALNPTFVFFAPVLASEHLYAVLLFSAVAIVAVDRLEMSARSVGALSLAGALAGAATLTRGDALFLVPVIAVVAWLGFERKPHRYFAVACVVLVFIATITPWYLRNHRVIGPGSGLSTSAGLNFYFAHNSDRYGWHPLEGSVFDHKDELQQQRLGYRLGLEYLAETHVLRLGKDVARGTESLFLSPSTYSVDWSTRLPWREGETEWPTRELAGIDWLSNLTFVYFALLAVALSSCLILPRHASRVWVCLYGIVAMNWVGYALIFWGKARYRYVAEVTFCVLAALVLSEIVRRASKPAEPASSPPPVTAGTPPEHRRNVPSSGRFPYIHEKSRTAGI